MILQFDQSSFDRELHFFSFFSMNCNLRNYTFIFAWDNKQWTDGNLGSIQYFRWPDWIVALKNSTHITHFFIVSLLFVIRIKKSRNSIRELAVMTLLFIIAKKTSLLIKVFTSNTTSFKNSFGKIWVSKVPSYISKDPNQF